MSLNTVSASGSGASEALCESYQALSLVLFKDKSHSSSVFIHLIVAENLLVDPGLNPEA